LGAESNSKKPGLITRFLIRFIINAAAIYVAAQLISGIHLIGWDSILLAAVIFGLVNAFIKPLVSFITCLIKVITLGLFTLVILDIFLTGNASFLTPP
jgi:putative membrane protein